MLECLSASTDGSNLPINDMFSRGKREKILANDISGLLDYKMLHLICEEALTSVTASHQHGGVTAGTASFRGRQL